MSFHCCFSVAGLCVDLETEHELVKNEAFLPFLTERGSPDIQAAFTEVTELPPTPAQTVPWGLCCRVSKTEDGNFRHYFYDAPQNGTCYAVAVCKPDEGRVLVEYLGSYRDYVSEIRNSVFHIGLESILLRHDRLCLHAACVDTALGGLLFSGVSGIGKSTQAELWCQHRNARQINGDRPILAREGTRWMAWGSPYAGSSRCHVNDRCAVSAILLLEQKKECALRRLTPAQAFRGIWAGLTVHSYDPAFVEKASTLAVALTSAVPVYRFGCTPDESAVAYLEKTLGKELSL